MSNFMQGLQDFANGASQGLRQAMTHTARAAATANGVSAAAQAAQGAFNQGSANNANAIGTQRLIDQWGFNSGQAASANDFTQSMWTQAAGWNEEMFKRSMEFNAQQAELNRQWQEHMASTQYQRAVKDMEKAGLNPILAATGGISTSGGSGSAASIGTPSMSGASGAMASGGLINGLAASEGNYTGQMEYMGGILGLMSAMFSGLSSASTAWAQMLQTGMQSNEAKYGYTFADFVEDIFHGNPIGEGEFLEDSNGKGQRGRSDAGSRAWQKDQIQQKQEEYKHKKWIQGKF